MFPVSAANSDFRRRLLNAVTALDALEPELRGDLHYEIQREQYRDMARAVLRPGKPRDMALVMFVVRLRRIYTVCTKKKPKCYASEAKGRYQGDFFLLCELVAKEDLQEKGRTIQRILNSIPGAQ